VAATDPVGTRADIPDHFTVVQDDQSFGHELVELGQESADALVAVDDEDDHGKVLGEAEDP
jgi:Trk K+ transport system NAD-binding subunit